MSSRSDNPAFYRGYGYDPIGNRVMTEDGSPAVQSTYAGVAPVDPVEQAIAVTADMAARAGTTIYEGPASSQGGAWVGGKTQIYILEAKPEWIQP